MREKFRLSVTYCSRSLFWARELCSFEKLLIPRVNVWDKDFRWNWHTVYVFTTKFCSVCECIRLLPRPKKPFIKSLKSQRKWSQHTNEIISLKYPSTLCFCKNHTVFKNNRYLLPNKSYVYFQVHASFIGILLFFCRFFHHYSPYSSDWIFLQSDANQRRKS